SVNDIASEIAEINSASATNSNGVEEIVDKNDKTTNVSRDIEGLAEDSKTNAESLENVVNQFRV
ncbi:MAG: hypothetical protein K6A92_05945, partial [Lachnospiraceae bacterium]|nr:hypothetical protein [Lachnospiraceae bacterium]